MEFSSFLRSFLRFQRLNITPREVYQDEETAVWYAKAAVFFCRNFFYLTKLSVFPGNFALKRKISSFLRLNITPRGVSYDTENRKFLGKTGKISGFGDEKISILSEKRRISWDPEKFPVFAVLIYPPGLIRSSLFGHLFLVILTILLVWRPNLDLSFFCLLQK